MNNNILVCGLGGQGVVTFGKLIGNYLVDSGVDIKKSNVIGLGQRGGNTECHIRYSTEKVKSPLIKCGDADYIISFELTETLRNIHYLKSNGVVISSKFEMGTATTNVGIQKDIYKNKSDIVSKLIRNSFVIDFDRESTEDVDLSNMINIVILGFFVNHIGFDDAKMKKTIKDVVSTRSYKLNIKAYDLGKKIFMRGISI